MNLAPITPGGGPVIVSGFGRCGSSLVMRMLHAGGINPICDLGNIGNSYESTATLELIHGGSTDWFAQQHGRSLKVLDLHRRDWPDSFQFRVIWLDRDPTDQSKSAAGFYRGAGMPNGERPGVVAARFRKMYKRDRPEVMRRIGSRPLLRVAFAQLINRPEIAAERIRVFAGIPAGGLPAMVDQVIRRPSTWTGTHTIEEAVARLSRIDPAPTWPLRRFAGWGAVPAEIGERENGR